MNLRITMVSVLRITFLIALGSAIPVTESRSTGDASQSRPFIESNSIQRHYENTSGRAISDSRALKRVFLSNRTVTCNDGSQAGFYLRKSSSKSKRWVVFFEGGWHCYDMESCKTRWTKSRHLMTSAKWPETRGDLGGILSPMATENPYWHDANHVLVPYCSSDSWSGTRQHAKDRWAFMGSLIVRQVIADLIPLGLGRSQGGELLLAGSSAGGLGVMLNLDKVKRFLRDERAIKISVRGVSDSGWFLDREPYAPGAVTAGEVVRQGWKMWEGSLPEACVAAHVTEPWRCYFGHRLYPTLKSPLFVFQWLFDEAQMRADSVGAPVTKKQWDYIHETGIVLRQSLDNVTAVFAPSCIGHAVLSKRDWLDIKVDDISLPEALRCWEQATGRGNKGLSRRASDGSKDTNRRRRRRKNNDKKSRKQLQRQQERQERHRLAKERRMQQKKRNGPNGGGNKKNNLSTTMATLLAAASSSFPRSERSPFAGKEFRPPKNGNGGQNRNKKRKNSANNEHHSRNTNHRRRQDRQQQAVTEPSRCSLRLLERCSWPQCNHSCPSITNPLTGKEMRFLELLSSFGLDIEAVASALGVDMPTLSDMDRSDLLSLLTQAS